MDSDNIVNDDDLMPSSSLTKINTMSTTIYRPVNQDDDQNDDQIMIQKNYHQHIEKTNFIQNELIAKSFAKYYPEEANFWMYAMIILGLAFIIFVAITIYKLCQPEKEGRTTAMMKQHRSDSMSPGSVHAALTTTVVT